ncbi:CAP-associated domain-containing protein [Romboutsia sp. 1001713B170207_170306_H8]|uniref:CAP domain-containing protein n=1 Tax=Romboutsia sp. 1001713B170207_170306_H8 TaxID=2787112 RepID=UPI000820F4DC|nr:CAP-associated domain-containing protein [Romboutsia sp. 1001713B170207_170306_H8]SCG96881.1 uncharacterized protein%2C YkwD family [uncultured Clostridium sp.]
MIKKIGILMVILSIIVVAKNNDVFTKVKSTIIDTESSNDIYTEPNLDEWIEIDNFQYIKIGDSKDDVISKIGEPSRIDTSEYDFKWYVYNQNIKKFAMVGIEDGFVVALYSNSINSCETEGINLNDSKASVNNKYDSMEYRRKGNTRYIIQSNGEYDIIKENKKYITIFYDVIENSKVCSYQIINQKSEDNMKEIYSRGSEELQKSFELETIDLINSTRAKFNFNSLEYSDTATKSARKHSKDMLENNYFDHINKQDETPFDRMENEGVKYMSAGENIASGQFNAIYAHEALMNSKGHRKNILGEYKYIGVGIGFGGTYKIYYTENFFM